MAEAIERPESNEELQNLSRELSQELALRDSLVFKKEKILSGAERHGEAKAAALQSDYQAIVDEINNQSAKNMEREVRAMGAFSNNVDEFNAKCGDFLVELARLKKLAEEGE